MLATIKKFFLDLDYFSQRKNIKYLKKKLGNKIDIMIDVGANIGESILEFNKNFEIKKIYSIEPDPNSYHEIKKNNFKNVDVLNFALSDTEGNDKLKIGYLSSMSTINKINYGSFYTKVKCFVIWMINRKFAIYKNEIVIKKRRLDNLINELKIDIVDLIKIDTEGHEFNVIKGLGDKIHNVKIILFEHHEDSSIIKNYTFKEVENYLEFRNFFQLSKTKMKLRKTYEFIYINKNYFN